MTSRGRFVVAAAAAMGLDGITKIVAVAALGQRTMDLGPIDLHIVRNDGVAFGAASFIPPVFLVLLTVALTVVLATAVWRGSLPAGAASGSLVGGAAANAADRIVGGTVIDMFDLGWWPTFNIADVCIVAGVAGLLLLSGRPTGRVVREPA